MSIISATWEVYVGGRRTIVCGQPWTKVRPYLKNKLKQKELKAWLKWQSTYLTSAEP
jgi:hypothetical protein